MSKKDDYNPLQSARSCMMRHGWWVNPLITLVLFLLVINSHQGRNADLNATAVSITTLEIFLAVIAVTGFWVIRREAIAAAEEVAKEMINERFNAENRDGEQVLKTEANAHKAALPLTGDKEEETPGL